MRHPPRRANARMMPDRDPLRSNTSPRSRDRPRGTRRVSPGSRGVRCPGLRARHRGAAWIHRRSAMGSLRARFRGAGWVAASARPLVPSRDRVARARIRRAGHLSERNSRGALALPAPGPSLRAGASESGRPAHPPTMGFVARLSRCASVAARHRPAAARAGGPSVRELRGAAVPVVLPGRRLSPGRIRPRCVQGPRAERCRVGMPGARVPRAARVPDRRGVSVWRRSSAISHAGVLATLDITACSAMMRAVGRYGAGVSALD